MTGAIKTTCAYCGVGCGIAATLTGPRSVRIKGDKTHPANCGALCSKGTHLGETVGLEGRLLHPEINGDRVSWDCAIDEVSRRMQDCIGQHGPDSVAFYVSGQLLTEDYYVANKLMKGFIGSGNIDTNSRLCMASAVAAHNRAFGEDVVPCTYDDLDHADLVVLVGSNTAWCHPVIWQRLEKLRSTRGTKLVVIDPRRTETAEQADLHVPVAPDGDVTLFNALLAEMDARGVLDREYTSEECEVPDNFFEGHTCDPGIDADLFAELSDLVAAHPKMVTVFSQGANQSVCGTDKGNAIINLHLATGRINKAGAGPFSITGQPNAMGGREVGGLANMLACHLGFDEGERRDVAEFWQTDNLCSGPGLKAVDLFDAVHSGEVKFLWIMATNPAVSMPNADRVRDALAKCPTVVVSDVMQDTDTGRYAHIKLPALAWGEKDGTVTNSERMVSRQRAIFAPPGEAKPDWQIVADVARAMGHDTAFQFPDNASVFREFAAMTNLAKKHRRKLDLTRWQDVDDEQYDAMEPFRWGGAYPFAESYPTSSGKARLIAVNPQKSDDLPTELPLRLNTGRYRDQWHTMTRTALSPKLSIHRREPMLEVHPVDARDHGLTDGDLAYVKTTFGKSIFRVKVTDAQARGTIFTPMHWSDVHSNNGRTGRLAKSAFDPVSGQPGFKNTPAAIAPYRPDWRAFLISRAPVQPDCEYWSSAAVVGGWLTELSGVGDAELAEQLPVGKISEATDYKKGMRRLVVQDEDGGLLAALFITQTGELPQRDWIVARLGDSKASINEILAGRPAEAMPETGSIVCVCHEVGEQQILAAIDAGASSVAEVGQCTKAGTNCGSCRPELSRMIEQAEAILTEAAQ